MARRRSWFAEVMRRTAVPSQQSWWNSSRLTASARWLCLHRHSVRSSVRETAIVRYQRCSLSAMISWRSKTSTRRRAWGSTAGGLIRRNLIKSWRSWAKVGGQLACLGPLIKWTCLVPCFWFSARAESTLSVDSCCINLSRKRFSAMIL